MRMQNEHVMTDGGYLIITFLITMPHILGSAKREQAIKRYTCLFNDSLQLNRLYRVEC